MTKTRISIKLNDYEYSLLYKIQTSCTMTGLLYNRAPPLNEIIKGLISFVYFHITQRHENLDMFFRTIKTDSEYPDKTLEIAVNIPSNAGNYIFIADEKDMELLHQIADITQNIYHEKYDLPKLIRYCIHYTLYGNIPLSPNLIKEKKYQFILSLIIGNLYYLSPRLSIELFFDPLINRGKIGQKNEALIGKIQLDEGIYNDMLQVFYTPTKDSKKRILLSRQELINIFSSSKVKEFNSRVSDFNFMSLFIGLFLIIDMWYIDSFDFLHSCMLMFLPHARIPGFNNSSLKKQYISSIAEAGLVPGRLLYYFQSFSFDLENLIKQLFDISKKLQ